MFLKTRKVVKIINVFVKTQLEVACFIDTSNDNSAVIRFHNGEWFVDGNAHITEKDQDVVFGLQEVHQ